MLIQLLQKIHFEDRGASMAEYGLLVVLIAIVALVAVELAGTELSSTYSEIGSSLVEAGP